MRRKRWIAGLIAVSILVAVIVVPWMLYSSKLETSRVRADFMRNHNGQIVSVEHPERYVAEGSHVGVRLLNDRQAVAALLKASESELTDEELDRLAQLIENARKEGR